MKNTGDVVDGTDMVSRGGVAPLSGGRTGHSGASHCNSPPLIIEGRQSSLCLMMLYSASCFSHLHHTLHAFLKAFVPTQHTTAYSSSNTYTSHTNGFLQRVYANEG
jgi:hypothetical protein